MKVKRLISLLVVVATLLSCVSIIVYAEDDSKSSKYLSSYGASLNQGTTGKLRLVYVVYATGVMSEVGISKIIVRNSDGSIYKVIFGTTSNGLVAANTYYHGGVYTISAVSGSTYYCTVTVYAMNASGADTRSVITQAVTCP